MGTDVVDDEFIMPGDDLSTRIYSKVDGDDSKFVIGPGLVRNRQKIVAVKPGLLKTRDRPTVFWIDSHQRRVSFLPILSRIFPNFSKFSSIRQWIHVWFCHSSMFQSMESV